MKDNNIITINARKFDWTVHRTWQCEMIAENADYFIFLGKFAAEVRHRQLGIIRPGTVSYEYYWKSEYFNVFQFHEPGGEFRNFYCNLNMPPMFANNILDYVDLDIDVLVWKNFSIEILDLDEYEANIKKYTYPFELQQKVSESLSTLLEKIKTKTFPFDIKI